MYICIDKTCMYNTYSKEVRVFKYTFYVSIKYLSTIILVNNQVSDVYISLMAPGFSFLYFITLLFFLLDSCQPSFQCCVGFYFYFIFCLVFFLLIFVSFVFVLVSSIASVLRLSIHDCHLGFL